jgi:hypothetical protein
VAGADVVRLPGDGVVARSAGSTPPSSFPVDDYARFVINDVGQLERMIVGPEARRSLVPDRSIR